MIVKLILFVTCAYSSTRVGRLRRSHGIKMCVASINYSLLSSISINSSHRVHVDVLSSVHLENFSAVGLVN